MYSKHSPWVVEHPCHTPKRTATPQLTLVALTCERTAAAAGEHTTVAQTSEHAWHARSHKPISLRVVGSGPPTWPYSVNSHAYTNCVYQAPLSPPLEPGNEAR